MKRLSLLAPLLCASFALGAGPAHADEAWKKDLQPEDDAWKEVEQVLTFNNGTEPETLDHHLSTGLPEGRIAMGLFEGLVMQDPKTLEPRPAAAESWTISKDGTVYTFKLRKSAKWSDGSKVTAKDFYDAWKRALTASTGCQYAYMLYPIKNAAEYKAGKVKSFDEVGVKATDDYTLTVTLHSSCPYFLQIAAFKTLYPIKLSLVEKHPTDWFEPGKIISNGPFILKEWKPNQHVLMVPNEHYWDRAQVRLKKIYAKPIVDAETSYKLFRQGKIDWMTSVPVPKLDEIKRLADYYRSPYMGSYFYRFNVDKKPFNDPRVRKALSIGFDREIITRDILKAGQIPATYFCPKMPGYEPPKGHGYDRSAARKLLAEAGYPGGKGFPTVALLYNTSEAHKQVAENIVRQWQENLGITVKLRNSEWKVYLADVEKGDYEIARGAWIGDYLDPNTFIDMWVTKGGNNNTNWSNKDYDKLIKAAATESDQKKRMKLFQQAESILVEKDLPIIPVYIYVNQGLLAEKVAGWHENVLDHHPLHYLWIEPTE